MQGKPLDRTIFVRPPKEAQTEKLWLLNKCVYGLADASRYWYLKVREELCKLGAKSSKLAQGIFYFSNGKEITGIIVLFVDDLLWAGKPSFIQIIKQFKLIFHIGSENSSTFKYIGINLEQKDDMSIEIDQTSYTESINLIPLTKQQSSNTHKTLNDSETSQLRSALGQLNWLSNMTRPEIGFQVSNISSNIKRATINDIKQTNKIIKYVKFPSLHLAHHYRS